MATCRECASIEYNNALEHGQPYRRTFSAGEKFEPCLTHQLTDPEKALTWIELVSRQSAKIPQPVEPIPA